MRKFLYLGVISIFLLSCEKTVPDPYPIHDPDPSKFFANQTILDTIPILSIAFDNDGTAWIGTQHHGLIKYGLTQTKVYNSQNSIVSYDYITEIAIDSKNNVWIGADGLIKYDGEKFYRLSTANSDIPDDHVRAIAIDSKDDLWLASGRNEEGGLARYDGESFEVFGPENSPLPVYLTTAIVIDTEDNVWVSAGQGVTNSYLVKISGESWTVYDSVDFKQKIYWINDLDIDSKNQVCGAIDYISSSERYPSPHVYCFDGINFETYSLDSIHSSLATIMVDRQDNFWYTFGYGYAYFDGDRWSRTDSEVINSTYVTGFRTIEQAPDGNIWIGTSDGIQILEGIE